MGAGRLSAPSEGPTDREPIATTASSDTSYALEVCLTERNNARCRLQPCNQCGCTPSEVVPVIGTLAGGIGYLKASNTGAGNQSGFSVALSTDGTTLTVGAPGEDSNASGLNGDQRDDTAENAAAVFRY